MCEKILLTNMGGICLKEPKDLSILNQGDVIQGRTQSILSKRVQKIDLE